MHAQGRLSRLTVSCVILAVSLVYMHSASAQWNVFGNEPCSVAAWTDGSWVSARFVNEDVLVEISDPDPLARMTASPPLSPISASTSTTTVAGLYRLGAATPSLAVDPYTGDICVAWTMTVDEEYSAYETLYFGFYHYDAGLDQWFGPFFIEYGGSPGEPNVLLWTLPGFESDTQPSSYYQADGIDVRLHVRHSGIAGGGWVFAWSFGYAFEHTWSLARWNSHFYPQTYEPYLCRVACGMALVQIDANYEAQTIWNTPVWNSDDLDTTSTGYPCWYEDSAMAAHYFRRSPPVQGCAADGAHGDDPWCAVVYRAVLDCSQGYNISPSISLWEDTDMDGYGDILGTVATSNDRDDVRLALSGEYYGSTDDPGQSPDPQNERLYVFYMTKVPSGNKYIHKVVAKNKLPGATTWSSEQTIVQGTARTTRDVFLAPVGDSHDLDVVYCSYYWPKIGYGGKNFSDLYVAKVPLGGSISTSFVEYGTDSSPVNGERIAVYDAPAVASDRRLYLSINYVTTWYRNDPSYERPLDYGNGIAIKYGF